MKIVMNLWWWDLVKDNKKKRKKKKVRLGSKYTYVRLYVRTSTVRGKGVRHGNMCAVHDEYMTGMTRVIIDRQLETHDWLHPLLLLLLLQSDEQDETITTRLLLIEICSIIRCVAVCLVVTLSFYYWQTRYNSARPLVRPSPDWIASSSSSRSSTWSRD